jgi:hypothetical protein
VGFAAIGSAIVNISKRQRRIVGYDYHAKTLH